MKNVSKPLPQAKDLTPKRKEKKKLTKEDIAKLRDRDSQPVKGRFVYHEVPGGQLKFTYLFYPGEEMQNYEMTDQQIYTIPLGVAKHLNKNGWYPVHQYVMDEDGKPMARVTDKVRRFSFNSLEFDTLTAQDIGEDVVNLTTVEKII